MNNWLDVILGGPSETEDEQFQGDVEALLAEALEAAAEGRYEEAFAIWRPLAETGVARAQSNLGACYVEGLGVERDPDEAVEWFTRGAEAGDAAGQRSLAALHFKGQAGLEQDDDAAFELYGLAAAQGDALSQDMLSWMLLEGRGAGPDPVEARRWALAAAEQGVPTSMTRLGLIAHNALGMERDRKEAARWWVEAARRDEPDGQAMLGAALHLGSGVARDDRAALHWLLLASAQGSALAEPFVGPARANLSDAEVREVEAAVAAGTAGPPPDLQDDP